MYFKDKQDKNIIMYKLKYINTKIIYQSKNSKYVLNEHKLKNWEINVK